MVKMVCAAVALAQVERIEELVNMRVKIAKLYSDAVDRCDWLKPQVVAEEYVHSYWTYVLKLETDVVDFTWYDFRKKYIELGGDGIYAAWKVNYLEPVFRNYMFYPKGCPIQCPHYKGQLQKYEKGLCPVAESIQPKILQFKTNYTNLDIAEQKAYALKRTIEFFD